MDGFRSGAAGRTNMAGLTVLASLCVLVVAEARAQDVDAIRIEHEHTLDVPAALVDDLWAHLTRVQDPARPAVRRFGSEFNTVISEEYFIDRYFDTHDLALLRTGSGIRHRSRFLPDDVGHRKHGRQLIHFKAQMPGGTGLTRTEARFLVRESLDGRPRFAYDGHPLVGLVRRSERELFLALLAEADLDPEHLHQKLEIRQLRQRIYVHRGPEEYATITLDRVTSRLWWKSITFHVVEIEANEKTYTESDDATRAVMKALTAELKAEIMAAFPALTVDPTPKYQRMYARFEDQWRLLPLALRYGAPVEVLFAAVLMLLVPGYLLARNRPRA
jgi:hypothetical protein